MVLSKFDHRTTPLTLIIYTDAFALPYSCSSLSEKLDVDNYIKGVSSVVDSTDISILNVTFAPLHFQTKVFGSYLYEVAKVETTKKM